LISRTGHRADSTGDEMTAEAGFGPVIPIGDVLTEEVLALTGGTLAEEEDLAMTEGDMVADRIVDPAVDQVDTENEIGDTPGAVAMAAETEVVMEAGPMANLTEEARRLGGSTIDHPLLGDTTMSAGQTDTMIDPGTIDAIGTTTAETGVLADHLLQLRAEGLLHPRRGDPLLPAVPLPPLAAILARPHEDARAHRPARHP